MRACLNEATLLTSDLETFIKVAKDAEFEAVELRTEKVQESLKRKGKTELSDLIRSTGLEVVSLNALENFSLDERLSAKMMDQAKEMMRICDIIGCETIIAISAPMLPGIREQEIVARTRVALEKLVHLGSEHGIDVCFEFLGFEPRAVRTLEESWHIVKDLTSSRVNLVIDTFHFYVGGSSLNSLEQIPLDRLSIVHINDVEEKPLSELRDGDRVFPGEGVMNPKLLIDRLKTKGYSGPLSVELFREDYWKQNPLSVARRARQSLDTLL
jgi:2-keto-myo-inositol isomerase